MTGAEFGAVLLAALASGAAAALKESASNAVSTAYEALKDKTSEILGRIGNPDVLGEANPDQVAASDLKKRVVERSNSTKEGERAEIGEAILKLEKVLAESGQTLSGVSTQEIEMIRTEVHNAKFIVREGGSQSSRFEEAKVVDTTFESSGQKKLD